jgi:SNF2 family DNA or RNA helicase
VGGGKLTVRYVGVKNEDELKRRMAERVIRRLKSEVLKELPDKTRVVEPVEISPEARKEYNSVLKDFHNWVEGEMKRRTRARMIREGLKPTPEQVAIAAAAMTAGAKKAIQLTRLIYLRQILGKAKVDSALAFIKNLVDQDEPVIAFAEHQDVIHALQKGLTQLGIRHTTIDGSVSNLAERNRRWNAFQKGHYDVFIGSQAAKEGIDLFRSSNVVFVERWWTPADEEQGEDRAARMGQKNAVTIWYLTVLGTLDEHLARLVEAKRQISDKVLGGDVVPEVRDLDLRTEILAAVLGGHREVSAAVKKAQKATVPEEKPPDLPPLDRIVALLFSRRNWKPDEIAHWLSVHGIPRTKPELTAYHWRVSVGGGRGGKATSKKVGNGIQAVLR